MQENNHRINISFNLGERLAESAREIWRQKWLEENCAAIDDYNRRIEQKGVFSDGLRRF